MLADKLQDSGTNPLKLAGLRHRETPKGGSKPIIHVYHDAVANSYSRRAGQCTSSLCSLISRPNLSAALIVRGRLAMARAGTRLTDVREGVIKLLALPGDVPGVQPVFPVLNFRSALSRSLFVSKLSVPLSAVEILLYVTRPYSVGLFCG